MLSKRVLNFARTQSYQTKTMAAMTSFPLRQKHLADTGLLDREFDYLGHDHKTDRGNFPHNYASYMKVLGADYDTKSAEHINNQAKSEELNRELFDAVEQ